MVYFVFDTDSKRNDYLNAIEPSLIESNYDKYNTSYKIRNSLIITYAVIWLYSQLDLLVFSDDDLFPKIQPGSSTLNSKIPSEINLNFQFSL